MRGKRRNNLTSKEEYFWDKLGRSLTWVLAIGSLAVSIISLSENKSIFLVSIILFLIVVAITVIVFSITNEKYSFLNQQIKYMKKAEHSIYIVFRSLSPEESDKHYRKYDETLQRVIEDSKQKDRKNPLDVKILAPNIRSENRRKGAEEIHERKIDIKFHDQLNNNDFRFMLVDDSILIISQQDKETPEPSRKCVVLKSHNLGADVKKRFEELWMEALEYDKYEKGYLEENNKNTTK